MNIRTTVAVLLLLAATTAALAEGPYAIAWKRQIGTPITEWAYSVAVDAWGNAYMCGATDGDLGGPVAGHSDAFLSKFDAAGSLLWTSQIGTTSADYSYGVTVDASGDAYICGGTEGDLAGPSAGTGDAFLSKFGSAGNLLWTTQIGSSEYESGRSVAVDSSGNAYMCGTTAGDLGEPIGGNRDGYVSKFDSAGNLLWTTHVGTDTWDGSFAVAVDGAGEPYVCGYTSGTIGQDHFGDDDVYVRKLDSAGNELWTTQLGTTERERNCSLAVDTDGNTYITGGTTGDMGGPNAGYGDVFLTKLDPDGNEIWTSQIGTAVGERGVEVTVDADGNIFVSGFTEGDLGGPNAGDYDAFLAKFGSDGNEMWVTQLGTDVEDEGWFIAMDSAGNPYIAGSSSRALGGPSAGFSDAVLIKYQVPEPATMSLLALGGLAALRRRKK